MDARYYVFRFDGSNFKLVQTDDGKRFINSEPSSANAHAELTNELRSRLTLQLYDILFFAGRWELFRRMNRKDVGYEPYCIKFEALQEDDYRVAQIKKEYSL